MAWLDAWDSKLYADGFSAGVDWANGPAAKGELRRLRRFYENLQLDWGTWWLLADEQVCEVLAIMSVIDPGSEDDPQAAGEHWEQIVRRANSDAQEPELMLGFIEGALDLEPSVQFADEDQADEVTDEEVVSHSEPSLAETGPPPGVEEFGKAFRQITIS